MIGEVSFSGCRVLVIGDMVADHYILGRPARISREAPVLVLHYRDEFICPGGAANVAHNLASLGAQVCVAGVIGDDSWGSSLKDALNASEIETAALVIDPHRATATKTRVVGGGEQEIQQQVVRIDRVDASALAQSVETSLTESVMAALGRVDAVILSDYANGVIAPGLVDSVLPEARRRNLMVTVDSHDRLLRFKGITMATPNQPEAEATLGREFHSLAELEAGGEELRQGMDADGVLITRGSQGMSLFQRGEQPWHLAPTNVREVFDPSGAGDTVSAVMTLGLVTGLSMREAANLSNAAAGEVVKKLGAATLTAQELRAAAAAPGGSLS